MTVSWEVRRLEPKKKIDQKDFLILKYLSTNARLSYKELGKKLHLSKVAVFNRIKKLEKRKIITISTAFIDFTKLGFTAYQIGIKTKMTSAEKNEYIQMLTKNPYLSQVLTLSGGKWDILLRVFCYENKINQIVESIKNKNIKTIDLFKIKEMSYLIKHNNTLVNTEYQNYQIDQTDLKLLHYLSKNSRASLVNIANSLKKDTTTIRRKIKKLIDNKIIISFVCGYDTIAIGEEAFLIFITSYHKTKERQVMQTLINNPQSHGGWLCLEFPNITASLVTKKLEDFQKFEEKLQSMQNLIEDYEFARLLEQSHYNFFPEGVYQKLREIV